MSLIKKMKGFLRDPEIDFDERVFLLFTLTAELAMIIAFCGDIAVKENPVETVALGLTILFNPLLIYSCLRWHKVKSGSVLISFLVLFVIMPIVFFFGGGPDGGAIIWFTFCAIYFGTLLKGRMKKIMLTLFFITVVIDYAVAWKYPWMIWPHSRGVYFVDSVVSVLAVGIFAFLMVEFQNGMYLIENRRAMEQSERAEQLNASQNQFFANMSHEIRTPINTILGLNEMILREDVSDEVKQDAENIHLAGELLLTVINDILDKSKLESGQMKLVEDKYNTVEVFQDVVFMLAPKAKEKHLKFDVSISPVIPRALIGDSVRIRQVLINIINNAIKYTHEGSVFFGISINEAGGESSSSEEASRGDEDVAHLCFTVRDTGIGIKKEDIPYLFSAFKRVDGSETQFIEGTGLGLSIVKQLVDLMGGTVTVNSVYTKGTTFVIEIPQRIADHRVIGEPGTDEAMGRAVKKKYSRSFEAPEAKLLIVDDNTTNLMVAEKLLRETKVQIDTVVSGEEALQKTLEREYHLILMDHLMPGMDGIECVKRIREQKGGLSRGAAFIALTANAGEEHKSLFKRAGFDGYVTKPVSGETLEAEVASLLPAELVTLVGLKDREIAQDTVQWMSEVHRKRPVAITTESVADLPEEMIEKYRIGIIPYKVRTKEGRFRDGLEIGADGLLRYMSQPGNTVRSEAPAVSEYEEYFAKTLLDADRVIHINVSNAISTDGHRNATEAALSFDNVFVVDSQQLSGGMGLLVLQACEMAERGMGAEEIIESLARLPSKIHTKVMVENLTYLERAGQVSKRFSHFMNALMVRPVLVLKRGKFKLGRIYFGFREHSWESFIWNEIQGMKDLDQRTLFIIYAGVSGEEISRIRRLIAERTEGNQIYFVQSSSTISANCGPGTLGIMYME